MFAVGFALPGWDNLVKRLRAAGFTDDEMVTSGLALRGNRGPYDRFRGRIVWPIRDLSGEVVGFGARRIMPDDDGPKYLNTPETPVYTSRRSCTAWTLPVKQIARSQQVVVVEGYTDVMACHLAGVDTAVATCGTAFGESMSRCCVACCWIRTNTAARSSSRSTPTRRDARPLCARSTWTRSSSGRPSWR